ncbi:hypothetical protein KJ815_03000, partial [bacterium]|nr:hypothetical protein [bacterium]
MAQKTLTKTGTFGVIGQVRIRSLLARSLRADRAAHAYLLVGPRGVGKAAIALEYARLLLCSGDEERPCAKCEECRLSQTLQHPDLHLVFPLPPAKRKGQSDDDNGDDAESLAGGIAEITKTLARDPYAPIIVEHQSSGSREATRSKGE